MNAISQPLDALIDLAIDRFRDSFASFFELSTTMIRAGADRSRSCLVRDDRHRLNGSGLSAVVTPTAVIGGHPAVRRGSTAKIGERETKGFA